MFNIASLFRKNVDKNLPMDVFNGEDVCYGVKEYEYNGFLFFLTSDADGNVSLNFQKVSEN